MDARILSKIQKLLAIGDVERNSCENERETAMRQANALLVKHGLSMADITDKDEIKESLGILGRTERQLRTKYVWESGVWSAIARLNGCYIVRTPGRGRQKIWLIGRQLRCEVVKSIAAYVVESIVRQASIEAHDLVSFGVGAWTGVDQQVTRILAQLAAGQVNGEQVSVGTALIIVDQHKAAMVEAKGARDEFFPRLRTGSYGYSGRGSGYSAGRDFGNKVGLNNQVGGNSGAKRLT